jgi:predicted transcriptional regulator
LKLSPELKARVREVAEKTGVTPHAFMIAAIEHETELAEQRRGFVADALAARADYARTGLGIDARELHAYLSARAGGRRATRPKARRWRK